MMNNVKIGKEKDLTKALALHHVTVFLPIFKKAATMCEGMVR